MKNIKRILEFKNLLETHGVTKRFLKECKKAGASHYGVESLNLDPERYLVDAFFWEDSIEGRDFWFQLNQVWIGRLPNMGVSII